MIERRVLVRPQADRLVVPRHALQCLQRRHQPAARMQNDRDHTRLFFLVARQRLLHLVAPAVVRRDEAGADQKQDDIGREQMPVDLLLPRCSGIDLSIVPIRNQAGASEHGKMLAELLPVLLVVVRVRVEHFERRAFAGFHSWHPRACCQRPTGSRIAPQLRKGGWQLAVARTFALFHWLEPLFCAHHRPRRSRHREARSAVAIQPSDYRPDTRLVRSPRVDCFVSLAMTNDNLL